MEIPLLNLRRNGTQRCKGCLAGYTYIYYSPEWICYDSPNDVVSFREEDILNVLDRIVEENGLSLYGCCFDKLEGKIVKPKKDTQRCRL